MTTTTAMTWQESARARFTSLVPAAAAVQATGVSAYATAGFVATDATGAGWVTQAAPKLPNHKSIRPGPPPRGRHR